MNAALATSLILKMFGFLREHMEQQPPQPTPAPGTGEQPSDTPAVPEFSVEWLQQSLNDLMSAGLAVDGVYGPRTIEAVKQFQSQHGLKADGWAGVQTCEKIVEALNA